MKKIIISAAMIAALSALAALTSCEREVDFNGKGPGPKLVVDVSAGPHGAERRPMVVEADTHVIDIREAVFLFGGTKPGPVDPAIEVSLNGEPLEVGIQYDHMTNKNYKYFRTPLKVGDRLDFAAQSPVHGRVTATDIVPRAAAISDVKTEWLPSDGTNTRLKTLVTIDDPADESNYYALRFTLVSHCLSRWSGWDWELNQLEWHEERYDMEERLTVYTDQEVLFNNIDGVWLDGASWGEISDEMFDGRSYTLNLYASFWPDSRPEGWIPPQNEVFNETISQDIRVEVLTLSEDLFRYRRSLTLYNLGDTTAEPVRIHSNVSGGYGIFGVYNSASFTAPVPWLDTGDIYY